MLSVVKATETREVRHPSPDEIVRPLDDEKTQKVRRRMKLQGGNYSGRERQFYNFEISSSFTNK